MTDGPCIYNKIIKAFSLTINAPTRDGAMYTAFDWVTISSLGTQCVYGSNGRATIVRLVSVHACDFNYKLRLVWYSHDGKSRPLWKYRIEKSAKKHVPKSDQAMMVVKSVAVERLLIYYSTLSAWPWLHFICVQMRPKTDPKEQDTAIVDYVSNNNKIGMKTKRIEYRNIVHSIFSLSYSRRVYWAVWFYFSIIIICPLNEGTVAWQRVEERTMHINRTSNKHR